MLKHLVVGSAIVFGSSLLAGCGATATSPNNGHPAHSNGETATVLPSAQVLATSSSTSSSSPTTKLRSAGQIKTTLHQFLKGTIASPSLPPVPSVPGPGGVGKQTIYYGVSAVRSTHPVGAVINFVGTSQPEPLNASAILPNHVALGNIIGSYAVSNGTPTTRVQDQWKNDTLGFDRVRDVPALPKSMLSTWMHHASAHQITLTPGVIGTVYTAPSELPAVIWRQSSWQFEISNLYAIKPDQAAISEARAVIKTLNGLGTLTGHGVFYMVAAGDGQHTLILWSHNATHLALTDYHSASLALQWLASLPQSPLVH